MNPQIHLDDFASAYSISFNVRWEYDPEHVLLTRPATNGCPGEVVINPIFESHVRRLKNWTAGDIFRKRFPELAKCVDDSLVG